MYLQILKKDLKRKKTMNIILLLFVILATTFVSSSVNNIIAVVTGLDSYFEKAGIPDYFVATIDKIGGASMEELLDGIDAVDSYGIEHVIYANSDSILYKGEPLASLKNTAMFYSFEDAELNYFDVNNQVIEEVEPGQVYVSQKHILNGVLDIGEKLVVDLEDVSVTLEIAGSFKDAALGADMSGNTRFLMNESDYQKFMESETVSSLYSGSLCYIETSDAAELERVLSGQDSNIISNGNMKFLKMTYVMDMVIAGVLLVVSVCLILVAFVVLKFTISFTLTEEYREIGVMKAIGIANIKIRGLYLVKYFSLAVIGAAIGFFAGIPFGDMLLESISHTIVLENAYGLLISIGCAILVVVVILLFCFGCTGKVKKYTPVDAIRNGTTGERFRKKGILKLSKTPMNPSAFLAVNDVLSGPRRFGTMILTFTICLSLVLILVNTVNTLKSGSLVKAFSVTETDAYLSDNDELMSVMVGGGSELLLNKQEAIEKTLAEHHMPAKCVNEVQFKFSLVHGEYACKSLILQGVGTTADEYEYFEGTPPANINEIAVTNLIAEKLHAQIGDTVIMKQAEGDREYMITALFQNMNNMGEGVRLHEDVELDFGQTAGLFAFQIDFTDNLDEAELLERIEKIKEIYDTDKVYTAGEYVDKMIGVSSILDSVRALVLAVVLIIIMLVTVLMERSFITKERGEIAILKAIGFRDSKIVTWHTIRFGIVSLISTVISLIFLLPLTEFSVGPIFSMMGADFGIEYKIVPLEVYVIYPILVLVVTMVSAFLTSLHVRSISASECTNIE